MPAATVEKLLPSASLTLTINGVDYVTSKNIVFARNVMEEQHPHGCGLLSWLRLPDFGRRDHRGDSRPAGVRQPGGRSQVRGPLRSELHGVDAAQGADHRHGGDPSPV